MLGSNVRIPGIRWVLAFIAAAMFAVAGAPGALAQQDDQYDGTVAPSGPAAKSPCTVPGDDAGVASADHTVVCDVDVDVAKGASVTLQDADGTQGTFVDGDNAKITEDKIIIQVTGEPFGVAGGDGVLHTEGLFVVDTTGIAAADDGDGATVGASTGEGIAVLPDTGGSIMTLVLAGGLLLLGAGFVIRRLAGSN